MAMSIELFAQFHDPVHTRMSVVLSEEQIILEPAGQPRFQLYRSSFERLADLVRRHDMAMTAAREDTDG